MKKISKTAITALLVFVLYFMMPPVYGQSVTEDVVEENLQSEEASFKLVKVIEDISHPWGISWLPDGSMIITERSGRMLLVQGEEVQELENLPEMHLKEDAKSADDGGNQGGLLDVVVHPDYENNGWIYFTYSSPGDDDGVPGEDIATGTALARARLNGDRTALTDVETIYTMVPRTEPGRHYGSRIVFPGDGTVIFSIGDRGLRHPSQDLTHPAGSMIRLLEDGGAAPDNPFIGAGLGNVRPEIYSYGHRNNQGMAIHPQTGEIWTTEHGPYGGDILHKIEKGNNYGWPQVSYGTEYSTKEHIGIGREAPGVTPAKYIWEESMAPSGLTFYSGDAFPEWGGNLFAGSLLKEELYRIVLNGDEVVQVETLFTDKIGRIRDVRQGPDGYIYLATDEEDGGIFRMEPATQQMTETED
jgi:aldose sugar dehydrogenase